MQGFEQASVRKEQDEQDSCYWKLYPWLENFTHGLKAYLRRELRAFPLEEYFFSAKLVKPVILMLLYWVFFLLVTWEGYFSNVRKGLFE